MLWVQGYETAWQILETGSSLTWLQDRVQMKKAKDDDLKGKTGDLKDDKLLKDFKQGCGMIRFTF